MAGQPLETGYVELEARGKSKVKRDLNEIGGAYKKTARVASDAAKTIATAFSGLAVLGMVKGVSDAYLEQERSLNRLEAAYKVSGRTGTGQMKLLADSIEDTTLFSDDAARAAASMLAPFERLSTEIMPRVISISADVATVMGGDIPEAAGLLGKALSDPEKGLRKLKQVGIVFSDAEKEVLKTMMDTNRVADAQAVILQRVEDRFKGAAEAAKKGLPAIQDNVKKSMEHIQEDVGAFWAEQMSPTKETGKVGLQDLPFAFAGNQEGKDAYQKMLKDQEMAADQAAKSVEALKKEYTDLQAEIANLKNEEATKAGSNNTYRRSDAVVAAAKRKELEQQLTPLEARIKTKESMAAVDRVELGKRQAAAARFELEAKKQKEVDDAAAAAKEWAKVLNEAAQDQQVYLDRMKEIRKRELKEEEEQLQQWEDEDARREAMKQADEARHEAEMAQVEAGMQFREEIRQMQADAAPGMQAFQSQRMNLAAYEAGIQESVLSQSIQQKALEEAKKQNVKLDKTNKKLEALDELKKMNRFGAGVAVA